VAIHVLAAHLGLRVHERRFQIRQILDHLPGVGEAPLVVLGDFNDWMPGRSVVDVLDQRLGRPPRPRSFPSRWPIVRLDRIWVHPTSATLRIAAHVSPLSRHASDHLPVVAEIEGQSLAAAAPVVTGGAGFPNTPPKKSPGFQAGRAVSCATSQPVRKLS
jgi:endonuclease/exonuclease/phosphatase family metal-dependent hydrolase